MTTDPFTEAASDAAEEQWTRAHTPGHTLSGPERMNRRIGFTMGAEWARTHLAAQEPTDVETGHAYAEWMNHSPIRDLDARRLNCTCGERGFTPYGYEHHRLRAALSAARAARRDEEKRDG